MSSSIDSSLQLLEFNAIDIKIPEESKTWDDFLIGQGGFANVYEVRVPVGESEDSTRKAALKKFKYNRNATDQEARGRELSKLKREAEVITQVSHSNIIHLFGVCYDAHFFGLILELCEGGSLGNVCRSIKKENTIALRVLANWAHQISSAMKYLTDRSILHRDLKADNVLVVERVCFCVETETSLLDYCAVCEGRPLNKLQLKVTDFGLSKTTMSVGDSIVGTLVWLAPEVFQRQGGQSNWSEFSDVWSFGVVLWELLAREMPHAGAYPIVVAHWNLDGQTLQLKDSWPLKWKEILKQCWSLNPKLRPSFESLVQYFEEYTEGLVEVHISDLPLERKNRKNKKTPRFSKSMCCFPTHKSSIMPKFSNNHNDNFISQRDKKKMKARRIALIFSILLLLSVSLISILLYLFWKPVPAICSDGFTYYNLTDSCYKTSITPVTQRIAREKCLEEGATLTSIHSSQENSFVRLHYLQTLKDYRLREDPFAPLSNVWIGSEFETESSKWMWSDRSKYDWRNWKKAESVEGAFWTILYPQQNGKWGVADNKKLAAFTCKKAKNERREDIQKTCSSGYTWLQSTGYCYKIEFNPFPYHQALRNCASDNAHLASIHSDLENSELVNFYLSNLNKQFTNKAFIKRSYLWTGLTFNNSKWSWGDGSNYNYTHWMANRPVTGTSRMVIDIENEQPSDVAKFYWRDVKEDNFFAFICQKSDITVEEQHVEVKNDETEKELEVVDKNKKNCTSGYSYFEKTGCCYKSGSANVQFSEANQTCIKEGAHLVSVHSKEENDFVIELAKKTSNPARIYTGLYYNGNHWQYTDGSRVNWFNWMDGEPNFLYSDLENTESKVTIMIEDFESANLSHDKWNNQLGSYEHGFVCKVKAF